MLTEHGKVAESYGACFFMIRDGRPITPPVTSSILESITRASLIDLLEEITGKPVEQRDIDRTELYAAEEAFLCGSRLRGAANPQHRSARCRNGQDGRADQAPAAALFRRGVWRNQ
jgi:hypothetical protein